MDLEKIYRDSDFRFPAYRRLTTEEIGPTDCRVVVTKYGKTGQGNEGRRRYQVRRPLANELLFDTDDCYDSGNALHKVMRWLAEFEAKYKAEHAEASPG